MADPKAPEVRIKDIDDIFFNLHPLKEFDHGLIFNSDEFKETDQLFLMFAMAWNDLKSNLVNWETITVQKRLISEKIDPPTGQISGLQLSIIKNNIGITHEFLNLLCLPGDFDRS